MSTEISLQCLEGEYIENAESAGGAGGDGAIKISW